MPSVQLPAIDSLGIRSVPFDPGAESGSQSRLDMTIQRLRWLAVLAPLAIVAALELARSSTLGFVSMRDSLALDLIVAASFIGFGFIMVRAIGQVHDRVKRQNRELLALHSAGLDVTSELALDIVLKKVVEQARALVGAKYGALSVVGDDGMIKSFITSGISDEQRADIGPPPVGHGVLGVVLREGQRLRLDSIQNHPRSVGFPANHPIMRTLVAVPIVCKSPFVGNLYLAEKEGGPTFTEDDEESLARFGVQAAIAIDNAHLHQQVADLAVAQERLRIAHEVHDGIAQVLGYVNTKVQAANAYLSQGKTDEAGSQLNELALAARDAYGDLRESLVNLRTLPSAERTVSSVLEEYLDRWKAASGVSTQLTIDPDLRIPPGIELQLIRIVQEALTNVRKHARATAAKVDIRRRDSQVICSVSDDGVGFNPEARPRSDFPRFGLSTMRERAESVGGRLRVVSMPGKGTTVAFELPVI
jgi:signal transduction histidine kinase